MKKKIILFFLIVFTVFINSGCHLYIKPTDLSDTAVKLYELKDTYIGDASEVRSVIDLVNNTEYKVYNIELTTDNKPYRLTINFNVDSRANYRYIDEDALNKMSALIFSLVKKLDEISYNFYDEYSDKENSDGSFFGAYYTKVNLCERISSDKITVDIIEKSTESIDLFKEYYKTVMSVAVAEPDREFLDKVYEFIGDESEIIINSGISAEIELDKFSEADYLTISEDLPQTITKYQGLGIKANLLLQGVRNFKTNEITDCMFLYYKDTDEGVIMIKSEFIDRTRYDDILKIIMREQSE